MKIEDGCMKMRESFWSKHEENDNGSPRLPLEGPPPLCLSPIPAGEEAVPKVSQIISSPSALCLYSGVIGEEDEGSGNLGEINLLCVNRGKVAHLQYPKWIQLKLPREGATFYTEDCFKASWISHKALHQFEGASRS